MFERWIKFCLFFKIILSFISCFFISFINLSEQSSLDFIFSIKEDTLKDDISLVSKKSSILLFIKSINKGSFESLKSSKISKSNPPML